MTTESKSDGGTNLSGFESLFQQDSPKVSIAEDLFGFRGVAHQVATGIVCHPKDESLVIGVLGPWGSGKTTMVNFVKHYVLEQAKSEKLSVLSIDFNPWLFSTREVLLADFLDLLRRELLSADTTTGKLKEKLLTLVTNIYFYQLLLGISTSLNLKEIISSTGFSA